MKALYVVTSADGYTFCTRPVHNALFAESQRLGLALPLTVHYWIMAAGSDPEWYLAERFQWC